MRYFFGFVFGAAIAGFVAAVVWPWAGPAMLTPCPLATVNGVWAWAILGGLKVLLSQVKP